MILAHVRLPDYWPKVACIAGAVLALLLLEVSLPAVLVSFVVGTYIADRVMSGANFWTLAGQVALLSMVLGILALVSVSPSTPGGLPVVWASWVDSSIAQLQESGLAGADWNWATTRDTVYYQGPFLFVGAVLVSLWISVGLAAHLNWFAPGHAYAAPGLRKISLPVFFAPLFVGLFTASFLLKGPVSNLTGGAYCLVSVLLFIQGSITLSHLLQTKGYSRGIRGFIYAALTIFGFYALVALGLMGPWILNRRARTVAPSSASKLVEEAI